MELWLQHTRDGQHSCMLTSVVALPQLPLLISPFLCSEKEMTKMKRDHTVRECMLQCKDPNHRDQFLTVVEKKLGKRLDKDERARLLLSYHKQNSECWSNNKR